MQTVKLQATLAPKPQGADSSLAAENAQNGSSPAGQEVADAAPPTSALLNLPAGALAADRPRRHSNPSPSSELDSAPTLPHNASVGSNLSGSGSARRNGSTAAFPAYQPGAVQAATPGVPPPPPMGRTPSCPQMGNTGCATPPRQASNEHPSPTRIGGTPPPPSTSVNGSNSPSSPARRRSGAAQPRNQPSSRIDPEQVPRPVGQPETAKEEGGKVYETNKYHVPPPVNSVCTVVDKGSSSCEFTRSTVNQVPAYPSTANTTHVPIAIICQPFAELTPLEEPVPLIDHGESGPFRCTRCRAYVNPHFGWASSGKEAICNFCSQRVDVPPEYYCSLDDHGKRRDQADRPELLRGSVDYIAPRDYSDVLPGLPGIMFVVEASQLSVQSGLFHQVLWTIRSLSAFLQPKSAVGIMTFNQTLQFYAFAPNAEEARQIIVADLEDPFVPCGADSLCVDVQDEAYTSQFQALLDKLPEVFAQTPSDQVVGCGALKAAVDLMGSRGGGHVFMFHTTLPNTGVGALRCRDDIRLYGTPEGSGLYLPQQPAFFDTISADCLAKGVAVSAFLAPPMGVYVDAASLSVVPRRTGGEFFFLPDFTPSREGEKLHYHISRTVLQADAYSCIFKLRCGKGLNVDSMHAAWNPEVIDQSTFQVSRMSPDATAVFVLTHSERIEGQKHAYFQAACLYTDRSGRRLIRVHTLQLPVTSSLSNVFRYTEIDTVTNMLIKQAASCAIKGDMGFKERLTKCCVDMLHAYRINCASTTAAGQLILPESLKLLPLYIGALRKMPAFRSGSDVRMDERVAGLTKVLSLPVAQSALLIYPRVYPLSPLNDRTGRSTGVGENVYMPQTVASSYDRLAKDGIFLVDNGVLLHLYVCSEVTKETLVRVFGVDNFNEVPAVFARAVLPEVAVSEDFDRIMAVVQQIRRDRHRLPWMPLRIVIPGIPDEAKLHSLFAEDRVAGEMQYVDFLCHIHKLVQNKTSY